MAWMLQLEDRRVLRVESPPPAPVVAAAPRARRSRRAAPAMTPDLTALVADPEPRVRRRAAMAIGRVGLARVSSR